MGEAVLSFIDSAIGVLPVSDSFIAMVDGAIALIINIVGMSSWLVPLNVLVVCLGIVFTVENFHIIVGVTKWVIELIRG